MFREESQDKMLMNTPEELQLQHLSNQMLSKILKVMVHGMLFWDPGTVYSCLRRDLPHKRSVTCMQSAFLFSFSCP